MVDEKQLNYSIFDALFGQAVIDNFYEEYNAFPPLEELAKEYTFSEKHEKRMKALFARNERKERFINFMYVGRKVAAVILILFTMFVGALMFNPEVRAVVSNTIISWYNEFVKFISPDVETEGYNMIPTYIPIGFYEMYYEEINDTTMIIYVNERGETILFKASRAAGALYSDSEHASYELFEYEGILYHILSSLAVDEDNTIIWEVNGWRYVLLSIISIESLQEMALSLEKK